MDKSTFTAKDISGQLDIPESTVRYWRDRYQEYIPTTGQGRKKRFQPDALEVFQFLSDVTQTLTSADDIVRALSDRFSQIVEVSLEGTAEQQQNNNNAATQQLPVPANDFMPMVRDIVGSIVEPLQIIAKELQRINRQDTPKIRRKPKEQTLEDVVNDIFRELAVIERNIGRINDKV
jgi:DNA-binding transcriptional MerR regulator